MPSLSTRLACASALAILIATPALAADETTDNKNCKIVERDASTGTSGGLSSSVTAGGGKVTANTTGGNSVTMNSGSGSVSSSVTTGSGPGGRSQTVVTNSDGSCTIYRDKEN
jgi:hypothetical protein